MVLDGASSREGNSEAPAFEQEQGVFESHAYDVGHRLVVLCERRDRDVREGVDPYRSPAFAVFERGAGREFVGDAADLGDVAAFDSPGIVFSPEFSGERSQSCSRL